MISAVDFLQDEILKDRMIKAKSIKEWNDIINKARKMEKEQIINAYLKAKGKTTIDKALFFWDKSEEYYNTTYKQNADTTAK